MDLKLLFPQPVELSIFVGRSNKATTSAALQWGVVVLSKSPDQAVVSSVVVVSAVVVVSSVLFEPSSLLLQEMMVRLKNILAISVKFYSSITLH